MTQYQIDKDMKKGFTIISLLCIGLLCACEKKNNCIEPIGIWAYFPYSEGDSFCLSNGDDTLRLVLVRRSGQFSESYDGSCDYMGASRFEMFSGEEMVPFFHNIGFGVDIVDGPHGQFRIDYFSFHIYLMNSPVYQQHYEDIGIDRDGNIISNLPDTLCAVSEIGDTLLVVKDVGIISVTDKANGDIYTLVRD